MFGAITFYSPDSIISVGSWGMVYIYTIWLLVLGFKADLHSLAQGDLEEITIILQSHNLPSVDIIGMSHQALF